MKKHDQLFRQAALERLASPDHIDRPIKLVKNKSWIALLTLAAGIAFFLFWGVSAKAPVKVQAQGLIVESSGLNQIVVNQQGRLKTLNIGLGTNVKAGEVIATFLQPELERELEIARAGWTDSNDRYNKLIEFYRENSLREDQVEAERLKTIDETKSLLNTRLALLKKKQDNVAALVKRKALVDDALIQAQLDLSDAKEKKAQLDGEKMVIAIRRQDRLSEQNLALLDEQLEIKKLDRTVKRLEAKLAEKRVIRSPYSGRIVEVMASAGDVVTQGKALAIVTSSNDLTAAIQALLYVNPSDGKRVKTGMLVEIIPSTFRPQAYGYMLGKVESISELPVTLEGMRRTLKNEQLAQDLSTLGAPFEMRVKLIIDPQTRSGYRWSSSNGPDSAISAGMLVDARIVVDRVRLINLAIPQFDRLFAHPGE